MKGYKEHNSTHTEPTRNAFAAPENKPKPYFASRPKRIFTKSTAETTKADCRQERNFTPQVGQDRGEDGNNYVYTAQVHNPLTELLCPVFETKHGTKLIYTAVLLLCAYISLSTVNSKLEHSHSLYHIRTSELYILRGRTNL